MNMNNLELHVLLVCRYGFSLIVKFFDGKFHFHHGYLLYIFIRTDSNLLLPVTRYLDIFNAYVH
jgi:phosphate starvation-inducible membrane PsiE